ncbi:LysE/ArgO family amino acid transporter [Nocardioides pacificus]
MLQPLLAGFLTGGSLIVAIGAQNAYVLRQGLLRHHVVAVVAICAVSDAVLIVAGVSGMGAVVDNAAWIIDVFRWLGGAFLLWYAAGSIRRALRPESLHAGGTNAARAEPRRTVVGRAVALTWLNPHVYLDTVLLVGSIAATYSVRDTGAVDGRWLFAIGAVTASITWFAGLGFGARGLAPLLSRPRAWQVLELVIAATMILVAAKLARG